MYNGDRSRKNVLVDHGFRLPSALDNRPMTWDEFLTVQPQTLYVSATPAPYEIEKSGGDIVELVVRPTGLVDPPVEIRPTQGQIQDIMQEIQTVAANGQRTLVTTLTKRLAEELDDYCRQRGVKTSYLHSDVKTINRVEILKDLRLGKYDALIGVNLLREGLDLPEVALVIILDADKEGFLRNATSLIQTIGRCARNVDGRVILYADRTTDAMQKTLIETTRRRQMQLAYNKEHNITPTTVIRSIETGMEEFFVNGDLSGVNIPAIGSALPGVEKADEIRILQEEMEVAANEMRYEDAGRLRDRLLELGVKLTAYQAPEGGVLRQTHAKMRGGKGKSKK
jgi:excinuclease ABC subunit B